LNKYEMRLRREYPARTRLYRQKGLAQKMIRKKRMIAFYDRIYFYGKINRCNHPIIGEIP
jgi:hypothetical protein